MKERNSTFSSNIGKIFLVAIAYMIASRIGLLLAIPPGYATAIWPASGIALATMILYGYSIWPGIWLGSFLGNITSSHPIETSSTTIILSATLIGIGAAIQALVGTYFLKNFSNKINFMEDTESVFIFIIFSSVLACLINATIGPLSLLIFGIIPFRLFWNTWLTWWLGDLAGVITVASFIIAWFRPFVFKYNLNKIIEATLLIVVMFLFSFIVFFLGYPLHFLLILLAIWAGFKFEPRFSTLIGLMLSTLVIYSILGGHSSFFGTTLYESLLLSQLFISVIFITIIVITAFLCERKKTARDILVINENLKKTNETLENFLSLQRATLESTADGIIVVNKQDKIVDYNTQFTKMWHIDQAILNKYDFPQVINLCQEQLQDPREFLAKVEYSQDNPRSVILDELRFLNGKTFEFFSQPQCVANSIVGRVWSFRDVTRHKNMESQLLHQATHDSLTDLPNRTLLLDRMEQAILNAERNHKSVAVFFFDMDNFKLINDNLGHTTGDAILLSVVDRLKACARATDTIARIGGDEFIVLASSIWHKKYAVELAKKFLQAFQSPFFHHGHELHLTCSIGISFYPKDGTTPENLLKNADSAMYKVKENGGNNFRAFTKRIKKENKQRLILENSLYMAYKSKQFVLSYQPLISFKTKKIVGAEVLLIWQHPDLGTIRPKKFIGLAETLGLIGPIGEWILRTACMESKSWQEENLMPARIAVNISANQFNQRNLVSLVEDILKKTKMSPNLLELEITENILMSYDEKILMDIHELKKMGIDFVLDDFGTGYSSLDYLRRFPVNKIKIDKSFISNVVTNPSTLTILKAMIAMAKNLELLVVAEGIETYEQLELMRNLGCDQAQGFYFSRPVFADEYKQLLKENKEFF